MRYACWVTSAKSFEINPEASPFFFLSLPHTIQLDWVLAFRSHPEQRHSWQKIRSPFWVVGFWATGAHFLFSTCHFLGSCAVCLNSRFRLLQRHRQPVFRQPPSNEPTRSAQRAQMQSQPRAAGPGSHGGLRRDGALSSLCGGRG
jgi:hypothetical protein